LVTGWAESEDAATGRLEIRVFGAIDTDVRDANLASRLRSGRLVGPVLAVGTISLFIAALQWMPATKGRAIQFWPDIAIPALIAILSFAWLIIDSSLHKPRQERDHFKLTIDPALGFHIEKGGTLGTKTSAVTTVRIDNLASIERFDTEGDKIIAVTRDGKREELHLSVGTIAEQRTLADRLHEALINARSAGGYRGLRIDEAAASSASSSAAEPEIADENESLRARVDK
jgi:hypothetical protein